MKKLLAVLLSLVTFSLFSQTAPLNNEFELLHVARQNMYHGVFLGISLILFSYNLVLYISIRDRSVLFYTIFMFLNCVTELSIKSYYYKTLGGAFSWIEHFSHLSNIADFTISFQFLFYLLFVNELLNIASVEKPFRFIMNGMIIYFSLLSVYFIFQLKTNPGEPINIATPITLCSCIFVLLTTFIMGLIRWFGKYKPARIFVLGNFLLCFSMLVAGLGLLSGTDLLSKLTEIDLIDVGFFVFNFTLAFSIGDKINILKKEKTEAQEKALDLLEEKVKERTAEVVEQKKLIEEKQKEIIDSIRYAKRIQTSLLPTEKYIGRVINNKDKA